MRLLALITYCVAGVRGYAATSLASVRHLGHLASPASALRHPAWQRTHARRCGEIVGFGVPRAPPACGQSWRCGGGKGTSGKRRFSRRAQQACLMSSDGEEEAATTAGGDGEAPSQPILILGAGWVGSRMARALLDDGVTTVVTNRPGTDVNKKPPYFRPLSLPSPPAQPAAKRVEFDVTDPETWGELPPADSVGGVIVTFPMSSPEAFWEAYLGKVAERSRPILCYSTTSVYQVDTPGQNVDERTPLRSTPRATAEEYIQQRGATLLTISGIFGDRRTPRAICTCLSTYTSAGGAVRIALAPAKKCTAEDPPADPAAPGVCVRAPQLNGRKRVNMVHVDDIVAATVACLETPQPGRRINVAGHHFALSELIQHCKHPAIPDFPDTDLSSKCVASPPNGAPPHRATSEPMPHTRMRPMWRPAQVCDFGGAAERADARRV